VEVPAPVVVIVGLALLTLLAIIIAPFRRVRAEPPLPADVETRVLMGESPRQIEAEIEPHRSNGREVGSEPVPPTAS
jgi:hypothetical protein